MKTKIIYKGKSLLDGKNIIVFASFNTRNLKTGNMVQTWIIPDNGIMPHVNVKTGSDYSVCGDCKHRPINNNTCYVKTYQAARAVYQAYLNGSYGFQVMTKKELKSLFAGKDIRIGAYGDPAAVPFELWQSLKDTGRNVTGYTHQWMNQCDSRLKTVCMASVDSSTEQILASLNAWRTFRVRTPNQPLLRNEVVCPASDEGGNKTNCKNCSACNGGTRRSSIAIIVHGSGSKKFSQLSEVA